MPALARGYHALVFIGNSYEFHCYEVCKVLTRARAHLDTKIATRIIDLLPTIQVVPNTRAFHHPNCAILKHDVWYYEALLCSFSAVGHGHVFSRAALATSCLANVWVRCMSFTITT